jgi:2-polyprenyl-3-methyl-5-hydroxy-6-metoxy-1,4-benzoquinol methylase
MDNTCKIRTRASHSCLICNGGGEIIYADLEDKIFGAPGAWSLRKCSNPACALVWLDPMPLEEDIGYAYRNYFTHDASESKIKNITSGMRYKFTLGLTAKLLRILLIKFTGLQKDVDKIESMCLSEDRPGRLLEVGCGSGDFLDRMHRLGWIVEGVDFDPEAVKLARAKYGLVVHSGKLEELVLPSCSYDAITMRHVIEHVHNPDELLQHCFRLLKQGGTLAIRTPNANSLGHRMFREFWRGLEPPRHIHLFTLHNLTLCLEKQGFRVVRGETTAAGADFILKQSMELKKYGKHLLPSDTRMLTLVASRILQLYEYVVNSRRLDVGEEIVLVCTKH